MNQFWGPGGKGAGAGEGRQGGVGSAVPPAALPVPSPHNTLYLELWCPAVAPSLVVASNKGKTVFNFGDIAVGEPQLGPAPPGTAAPQGPRPGFPRPPLGLGLEANPTLPFQGTVA